MMNGDDGFGVAAMTPAALALNIAAARRRVDVLIRLGEDEDTIARAKAVLAKLEGMGK